MLLNISIYNLVSFLQFGNMNNFTCSQRKLWLLVRECWPDPTLPSTVVHNKRPASVEYMNYVHHGSARFSVVQDKVVDRHDARRLRCPAPIVPLLQVWQLDVHYHTEVYTERICMRPSCISGGRFLDLNCSLNAEPSLFINCIYRQRTFVVCLGSP